MSKSLFSVSVLLLFALQISYAQPSIRDWLKGADAAYDTGDYYNAFRYYGAALKYKPAAADSLQILWKYAESARQFNAYLYAKRAYKQVIENFPSSLNGQYPYTLGSFRLAQMEQTLSVYDTAAMHYQFFIDKIARPGTREANEALAVAQKGMRDCQFALQQLRDTVKLTVLQLPKGVNTIYSDFGASVLNDTLYYTSFKYPYNKDKTYLKRKREFNKVLTSVNEAPGELLPDSINVDGDHIANTAFNHDGTRMYYNVCEYISLTDVRCDLYMRERSPNGGWGNPRKLSVNVPNATNTQPSVGYNEHTRQEVLFFASDRAGGKGKKDIWWGNINKNGDVMTAAPISEINTPENDATPFFLDLTQTLYYSSEGMEGMGGYDVYETTIAGNTWTKPKHINYPVNTSYDDLYLSLKQDGTMGYLSSNRLGSTLIDKSREACCLDIFKYNMEVELQVTTCNQLQGTPLIGATVELFARTANGDTLLSKQTNTKSNEFSFPLMPGNKYLVRASYPGYETKEDSSVMVNSVEFADKSVIKLPICLGPPINLQVNTLRAFNGQPLAEAHVELYEVTPTGEQLLASKDNPSGNQFTFQVERNKQYNIKASRMYFFSQTEAVDLTKPEYKDSTLAVRNLYFNQEMELAVVDSLTRTIIPGTTVTQQDLTETIPQNLGRQVNTAGGTFLYEKQDFDMDRKYRFGVSSPGYNGTLLDWPDQRGEFELVNEGHFVDTIPLAFSIKEVELYFDHDNPNPHSHSPTTTLSYDQTVQPYVDKQQLFIDTIFGKNRSGLTPQDSLELARYTTFFQQMKNEVTLSLDRLANRVLQELEAGKSVSLTIQGFCSPSGQPGYNVTLSQRRIACVENYLLAYGKDGKTLADFNNTTLKINKTPFGFSQVSPRVRRLLQGSRKDAIYNIAACLERKVKITNVIIK